MDKKERDGMIHAHLDSAMRLSAALAPWIRGSIEPTAAAAAQMAWQSIQDRFKEALIRLADTQCEDEE